MLSFLGSCAAERGEPGPDSPARPAPKVLNKVLRMEKVSPVSEVVKSCQDREGREDGRRRIGERVKCRENCAIHISKANQM